jgi:WD40 repeat protein
MASAGDKRADGDGGALVLSSSSKRQRVDGEQQQLVLAPESRALAGLAAGTVPRTSSLDAPTMLLTGHADAVLSVKCSPDGAHLASGASDKGLLLWNVRGDCQARARARARARAPHFAGGAPCAFCPRTLTVRRPCG